MNFSQNNLEQTGNINLSLKCFATRNKNKIRLDFSIQQKIWISDDVDIFQNKQNLVVFVISHNFPYLDHLSQVWPICDNKKFLTSLYKYVEILDECCWIFLHMKHWISPSPEVTLRILFSQFCFSQDSAVVIFSTTKNPPFFHAPTF